MVISGCQTLIVGGEGNTMNEELVRLGEQAGTALKKRGQTIAVAEGATGGLISAGLLTLPGATAFFLGSGVLYSAKGREILLNLSSADVKGMKSVTESYALLQASAIRKHFGADWGVAESGSAGPTHPLGVPSGTSCIAVVGPGISISRSIATGNEHRTANMVAFATAALKILGEALDL